MLDSVYIKGIQMKLFQYNGAYFIAAYIKITIYSVNYKRRGLSQMTAF